MEFVFVVPRSTLFPEFYPHGFLPFGAEPGMVARESFERAVGETGFFVERDRAERTPAWKQVIPYTIVRCGDRVLLTRRTKRGGEARLHDKHSIGIGGHLNPEDADATRDARRDPITSGSDREIREELVVRGEYEVRRVGLLNDDSNSVGAVHVGVVQVATVRAPVEIREREQLEGRLVTIDDLRDLLAGGANFETWSQLLIPHLDELLPQPLTATP